MQTRDRYKWEIELASGEIITNHNNFNLDEVVRVGFTPALPLLPRHDIIISDCKFIKRFGRAFMSMEKGVKEYLHCVVTDKYRIYIRSTNGQCTVTPQDYELYL